MERKNDPTGRGKEPAAPGILTEEEVLRYGRHLVLPEISVTGQRKLKGASVLVVGAGGLGSPLALYLAAAGIGRIGIVDPDTVDRSNLQRQVLYSTSDIGAPKAAAAKRRIEEINPNVRVDARRTRLSAANALEILAGYDVVADATDNFPSRYLVNDACVLLGKPNVHGSIFRFEGQVSVFDSRTGPCYRCLYPEPPPPGLIPSCAEAGVIGVLPGLIGVIQANEAMKIILGIGEVLLGKLLHYDALRMRFREIGLRKDPRCPICGKEPRIRELSESGGRAEPCGEAAADPVRDINPRILKQRLDAGEDLLLLDVREPHEALICRLRGSVLLPLEEIQGRLGEIDADREVVVYCHIGVRSRVAAFFLVRRGFRRVWNLAGGVAAWAADVDPEMPVY
ncbi:MAG: molybdopterin-synthase adenylyltransferase MoeB [Candidatus Eisenbacteria bacterium]